MKINTKSLRFKMMLTLSIVIIMIIAFLVIVTGVVLETIYITNKKDAALDFFQYLNSNIDDVMKNEPECIQTIEKTAINNSFDIAIIDVEGNEIFLTNKNFIDSLGTINEISYKVKYSVFNQSDIMYNDDQISIRRVTDKQNGLNFLVLIGKLPNSTIAYIRMPLVPITDSAKISKNYIIIIGAITIIIGAIAIIFVTAKFTKPIEELNDIAKEMSKLKFKRKFRIHDTGDEVDELGKSINTLSDKLEDTIKKLQDYNNELERNIEEKSKIDEMRKKFISDVSHELKTPIALIQGYSEGLLENVNSDEESRKFYAEVIQDEASKMDKLVKKLLELMKLENNDIKYNDNKFDIVELIHGVIKNHKVNIDEENIKVTFNQKEPVWVFADDFYIEQVVSNYVTNAIKNVLEVNKKKEIVITLKNKGNKVRITVFNTGKPIDEDKLDKIWTRFYKADESRDRSKGGTGIGLALVRAIMVKYNQAYGVENKKDGVEFYFEIAKSK